jgi:uncharacterized protein
VVPLDPLGIEVGILNADDAPPGGAGDPTFYIEWHTLGSAGSIMAHMVPLVVNGVFERLPTLRVVLIEGGVAWLPGILWRLDTNWRGLREDTPWLTRKPSEIVREHIRFHDAAAGAHRRPRRAALLVARVGRRPEILCFSSDYPHWDGVPTTSCAACPRPGASP